MTMVEKAHIGIEAWPRDVREALQDHLGKRAQELTFAIAWIFGAGRLHPAVQQYTAFLKRMGEAFQANAELFDLWSPPGSAGRKDALRLSNPEEQMYIANHLYVLSSEGVPGCVLECGCAHGFSSACLSLACAAVNRKLVVADSFEGLPAVREDQPFFRKGDYASSEEEVLRHIGLCGDSSAVRTVKGWYSESLKEWNEPIAILWMDVDLYESARDLLGHVLDHLDAQGALFTHEFTDFHGVPYPLDRHNVPSAIHERFVEKGYVYRAEKLCRYWGIVLRAEGFAMGSHVVLDALLPRLWRRDFRWRRYDELQRSTTVRTAFCVKKWLMPWRA